MKNKLRDIIEDWLSPVAFLTALLLLIIAAGSAGCASGKATSQKTLAGIQYAKDAALKTWGAYVAREQRRADALPEGERQAAHAKLLDRRLAVDDAVRKFQAAWKVAFVAANYDDAKVPTSDVFREFANLETMTAK